MKQSVIDAIRKAAEEDGIDPAFALAVGERESNFNPSARNSSSIRGIYQMRGDHRRRFGIGDSDDPYVQTKGWNRFIKGEREAMKGVLGRDPSDGEAYAGHHFGATRAARMVGMDPSTPVHNVFTTREIEENPHFGRAGTVGKLLGSVTTDIDNRRTKFGAAPMDFSAFGEPVDAEPADFGAMGQAVDLGEPKPQQMPQLTGIAPAKAPSVPPAKINMPDFSALGAPVT